MAEMKAALTTFGVAPERIHLEILTAARADDTWCRPYNNASSASPKGELSR